MALKAEGPMKSCDEITLVSGVANVAGAGYRHVLEQQNST